MKDFHKVVKEINRTLNNFALFDIFLNCILIFLAGYLFLSFFNFYPIISAAFASVYFVYQADKEFRRKKRRMGFVESKYGPLRDKLRTAVDNMGKSNPIINHLHFEVFHNLQNIERSSFLDLKQTLFKSILAVVFCILIVLTSTFYIDPLNFGLKDEQKEMISNIFGGSGSGGDATSSIDAGMELGDSEIYGDETEIIELGNEKIDVKMQALSYENMVPDMDDIEKKRFEESFFDDLYVESDNTFEETIPIEQEQIVKKYFEKLAEG